MAANCKEENVMTQITVNGKTFKCRKEVQEILFSDTVDDDVKLAIISEIKNESETDACSKQSSSEGGTSTSDNQVKFTRWNVKDEKYLVQLRADMEAEFITNKSHTTLWSKIIEKLAEKHINVTQKQAIDKWKNLKKKFFEVFDDNNKTGNDRRECKHYEVFSELYGTKAATRPKIVMDSDKPLTQVNGNDTSDKNSTDTSVSDDEKAESSVNGKKSRKRKFSTKQSKGVSPSNKLVSLLEQMDKKNDVFLEMYLDVEVLMHLKRVNWQFYYLVKEKCLWLKFRSLKIDGEFVYRNMDNYLCLGDKGSEFMSDLSEFINESNEDLCNLSVSERNKNVRVLASRPKLTNSGVLFAALEVLVDCAVKAGHAESEHYTKALQTCRQYEDHDDLCSLCLKLVGSSEDKKISSIIVDWA
ncbi:hypothetical protein KUTeg_011602 [Tegillarca granosa]|uniref:Myb/SANT-like DNA-binding domain-containing protein n=1 Tax=Tegillarca granosa TaxID=220873 RepID=A0ABQ9F0G1_TEGGR|nr:hypothetical protein KUTeg_011602 [Tegillarca granosa]